MSTLEAYIYDKSSGLLARHIVTDDYADEPAFLAAHMMANEGAVITHRPMLALTDPAEIAKASKTDDELQDIISAVSGIVPPMKIRYALVDTDGVVFDVVETRRADDNRLAFNKTVPQFSAKPHLDATVKDKINPDGSLTKYVPPKPADVRPDITIAELIAQREAALGK